MLKFKRIKELRNFSQRLAAHVEQFADSDYDFMDDFGGDVYVANSADDLRLISGVGGITLEEGNLTAVADTYDVAEIVEEDPRYLQLTLVNNNAGGDVYFVDRELLAYGQPQALISARLL